jgi:hypothetical protein
MSSMSRFCYRTIPNDDTYVSTSDFFAVDDHDADPR